jgi:hypothetical protein
MAHSLDLTYAVILRFFTHVCDFRPAGNFAVMYFFYFKFSPVTIFSFVIIILV